MDNKAFYLVIASAVLHALWNFAARKTKGNLAAMWLGMCIASLLSFPVIFLVKTDIYLGFSYILATGIIHAVYFVLLAKCYETGEISFVYPIARGVGVAGTAIIAMWLLQERIHPAGALGIIAICLGIGILAFQKSSIKSAVVACAVGISISCYSVVDKVGVTKVNPFVYVSMMFIVSTILTAPYVLVKYSRFYRDHWNDNWISICTIGLGSISTYTIILFAFQQGNVSYIVAAREFAVVIGAILGFVVLKEKFTWRKALGICCIMLGLIMLKYAK